MLVKELIHLEQGITADGSKVNDVFAMNFNQLSLGN
jgi:hypothetical protein